MKRTMSAQSNASAQLHMDDHRTRGQRFRDHFRNVNVVVLMDTWLPVIHPEAMWKQTWDVFIMCMVVYTALVVPLELSFGLSQAVGRVAAEYAMDMCFFIDLCLNFRTAYYNHQVREHKIVCGHHT